KQRIVGGVVLERWLPDERGNQRVALAGGGHLRGYAVDRESARDGLQHLVERERAEQLRRRRRACKILRRIKSAGCDSCEPVRALERAAYRTEPARQARDREVWLDEAAGARAVARKVELDRVRELREDLALVRPAEAAGTIGLRVGDLRRVPDGIQELQ